MAKMSGPEEFFEVFRSTRGQQQPQPQPQSEKRQQPEVPRTISAAQYDTSKPMTVTVKVSTLAVACVSALLLILLAYFIGLASMKESGPRPLPADEPVVAGPVRGQQPTGGTGGQQPGPAPVGGANDRVHTPDIRGQWVVDVITYSDSPTNRRRADEVKLFLQELPQVKNSGAFVAGRGSGSNYVIWVGPFESATDQRAIAVRDAIRNSEFRRGHKDFAGATLVQQR